MNDYPLPADRYTKPFAAFVYAISVVICVVLIFVAVRDFGQAWSAGVQVVTATAAPK